MEAMSLGERRRIITLYQQGWSTSRIATALGRSKAGVRRIRQHHRSRGHLRPLKRGDGPPRKVSDADRQRLAALVQQQPDATLDELLAQSQLAVSRSTIDRHLRALRLTFKKK